MAAQPRMNESVKRKEKRKRKKRKKRKGNSSCLNGKKQKLQHPDFARGPPPHYYPGQNVLNFADQTGCGALTIVAPNIQSDKIIKYLKLLMRKNVFIIADSLK